MFLQIAEGVVEIKEPVIPVRFHNVNGKLFKENLVTGETLPIGLPVLLTIDDATGAIEGEQRGFVLDHEIVPPVHPMAGKTYVKTYADKLPTDFMADVIMPDGKQIKKIAYKWDGMSLQKKTKAEME